MKPSVDRVLAASATALAIALLLFGITAIRAVGADAARVDVEPPLITPVSLADSPADESEPWAVTAYEVGVAANSDPFRADRRRSPRPYRIGGPPEPEGDSVTVVVEPVAPPAPPFRLLGTVATGSGGLAVIEVPEQGTRVVSVGNSIGGYRLLAVGGGNATMSMGPFQHTLEVAGPSPEVGATAAVADRQQAQGRQVDRQPAGRRQMPDRARPERFRGQGVNMGGQRPNMERIREIMQQRGMRGGSGNWPQGGTRSGGGNWQQRGGEQP